MGIEVKHGSDGTAIKASFAGGQAMAQQRREQQSEEMLRQNEFAKQSQQRAQAFQADQAGLGREFQAEQAGLGREFQAEQGAISRDWQRDNIEFELSAKQRAEFNKLSDAYEEAKSSGLYEQEELDQLRRDLDAKQMGIEPRPRMKEKSPWPEGQGIGQTWIDDKTGMIATRNMKGDLQLKPNPRMISPEHIAKWTENYPKKYDEDSNEIPPKPEELKAWIKMLSDLWREANGLPVEEEERQVDAITGATKSGSDVPSEIGPFKEVIYDGTQDGRSSNAEVMNEFRGVGDGVKGITGKLDPTEIETLKKEIIANEGSPTKQLELWEAIRNMGRQAKKKKDYISEGTNFNGSSLAPTGTKFSDPAAKQEKGFDWDAELKNLREFTDISTIPKRARDVALDTPVVGDVLPVVEDMGSNAKQAVDWLRGKSPQEKKKLIKEKKAELWDKMHESKSKEERKKITLEIQALEKLEE